MLASIHPLGERARGNRWGLTAAAYVVGSLLGGAALGAVLGTLGWTVGLVVPTGAAAVSLLVAAVCALGLTLDLGSPSRIPTRHRQVDENWLGRYRGWVYGVGFGFQLGLGVVTVITSATVYVTFALAALAQSTLGGAAVGAVFGLARSAPMGLLRRVTGALSLQRFHQRFQAAAPAWHRMTLGAQGAGALTGVAVAASTVKGPWPF